MTEAVCPLDKEAMLHHLAERQRLKSGLGATLHVTVPLAAIFRGQGVGERFGQPQLSRRHTIA
jgi:hypothetical protein